MKLNKVLALALSGVMAVSMLAGCSGNSGNGGQNGEGETPIVESGAAASVIAALDSETKAKVSFSSNATLQTNLETAIRYLGAGSNDVTADNIRNVMLRIDANLADETEFPYVGANNVGAPNENEDKTVQSVTLVHMLGVAGADEAYAAKQLAAWIDSQDMQNDSPVTTCADLLDKSMVYGQDSENEGYWYSLKYTGDVAFASVTDAVTGQVDYVVLILLPVLRPRSKSNSKRFITFKQ